VITTGFALLLSVGGFGSSDCSTNTLWIVSVSLLGFIVAFSIVLVIAIERIRALKRLFYGYSENAKSMRTIEMKLEKKKPKLPFEGVESL